MLRSLCLALTRAVAPAVAVLLAQATLVACNAQSVTGLYDFSGRKAVQVMAVLRLTTAPGAVPLSQSATPFVLNAYSVDARSLEVPLGANGQAPVLDLAVSVTGSVAEVPLVAVVPKQLQPGADGSYSLRFVATPTAASARGAGAQEAGAVGRASAQVLGVVDGSRLEALAGDVREGTRPADNTVEMSLATTLAVDLVREPMQAGDGETLLQAYRDIGALLHAQQATVEGQLTAGAPLEAAAYLKTVIAAMQAQVVSNVDLQASVVAKVNALALPSSGSPALPALAQVAEVLAGWASSAQAALDPVAHPEAKALPATFLQAASSTQTTVSAATSLTPLKVSFADTDASDKVAGTVIITPPRASAGISGYRVYFGGATKDSGRETLIGMAPAGQSPTLLVAAQSPPSGAGYMWVWPVSAGHELPCPYRLPLVNLGAPAAPPSSPALAAPAALAIERAGNNRLVLSWSEVAGATGYRVLYSPGAGFDAALSERVDVPSGHTVTLTNLHNGIPYTIVVRALRGGLVSAMSAPVTGEASEPVAPANVHVVATDDGQVSLAWSAVAGATAYGVYWTPGAPVTTIGTNREKRPTPYFTHTGLDTTRTYHYAVAAVVDGEEGPLSNEITARPIRPLGPPGWVAARTLGAAEIRISWPAVAGAKYYCLYQSNTSPVALPTADAEVVHATQFTAANLPDRAVRFFAVASHDGDGNQTPLSPEIRGMVGGISPLHNRQDAAIILGQSEHHLMQSGTDSALFAADSILGVALAHSGALFVSDSGNNRVLGYPSLPTQDNMPALFAVNGADLTTAPAAGYDYGHLTTPVGLSATTGLFIADTDNQRVVLHRPLPTSGPHLASALIGVSLGVGPFIHDKMPTARDISRPVAVHAVGGRLLVADATANRVVIFNPLSGEPAPAASIVLGQNSMTGYQPNFVGFVNAMGMNKPTSVWSDGERVLVADSGNYRVLVWNTFPTQSGQPADVVIGQTSGTSGVPDAGSPGTVSGVGFGEPTNQNVEYLPGVSSNGSQIVVTDPGNFRVLVWDSFPTANGTPADHVQGQNGLGDRDVPGMPNITSLHAPSPVYMDNQRIIVGDPAVPRVAIFGPYID